MRRFVLLLVLLNVLIFGYFELSTTKSNLTHITLAPLQADKIKLLTPKEIEALPKKNGVETFEAAAKAPTPTPLPAPVQTACYEWGSFSAHNLLNAQKILTKLSLQAKVKQQTSQESKRYWVYIPPRPSLQAAQAKVGELKALGVEESFIIQEAQWRNAISFGVFKDEQLATKLLEDLKSKGVNLAVKAIRNQESGRSSLLISDISPDKVTELNNLKPDFAGSELKEVSCQ
jgi:hypothetical protein